MTGKPTCKLTGTDGNAFAVIGNVSRALRKAKLDIQAREFQGRAMKAGSYNEILTLCFEYVEVE